MTRVLSMQPRRRLVTLGLVLLVAGCATGQAVAPAQSSVAVYPTKGQPLDQQHRDGQECAAWARQTTGYNPSAGVATGVGVGAAIGALGGAAAGAAIGAVTGDPGTGAAIGAVSGALGGGAIGGTHQYRRSRDGYERAFAACMSGRGYSVAR